MARARAEAEQPWLFVRRGLDWRWVSWAEAAERVAERASALDGLASGALTGLRVGYPDDRKPAAVVLDLALFALGAIPVPLPVGEGDDAESVREASGCDLQIAAPPGGPGAADALALPAEPERSAWKAVRVPPGRIPPPAGSGVTAVWKRGGWAEVSAGELDRRIAAWSQALSGGSVTGHEIPGREIPGREIVVQPRPLADPWGRTVLAWSIVAGAALVLEPDAAALPTTAQWVRPTVFAGDADELEALWHRAGGRGARPRWPWRRTRLPWGRLRTVVALGEEPDEAAAARWRRLGVTVAWPVADRGGQPPGGDRESEGERGISRSSEGEAKS